MTDGRSQLEHEGIGMTERKEGGEGASSRTREFEQGDKVLGRCVVDRCVRRDRLASFYSSRALDPDEASAPCSIL